jgi:energy-coupling factor transporter transmembrane protein EcfT
MTPRRRLLLAGMPVALIVFAFFMRDVVYAAVIVPLAYLLWLGKYYYSAVPQVFLWVLLLVVLLIVVTWNFLPEPRPSQRKRPRRKPAEGQIEVLAGWIHKSRKGNYFKWQLANRLGRIARRLTEISGQPADPASGNAAVDKYIDAGLNYSFVDFPAPKNRFERSRPTALDLDPKEAVDYLESQMELRHARHP